MLIKTMALKITEKSYPVAVACLSGSFAIDSPKHAMGRYLVINEVNTISTEFEKAFALSNRLYTKEEFAEIYEFVDPELKTNFTEVRRR